MTAAERVTSEGVLNASNVSRVKMLLCGYLLSSPFYNKYKNQIFVKTSNPITQIPIGAFAVMRRPFSTKIEFGFKVLPSYFHFQTDFTTSFDLQPMIVLFRLVGSVESWP